MLFSRRKFRFPFLIRFSVLCCSVIR